MGLLGFSTLAEVYDHAVKGQALVGVEGWTLDPLSGVLLIIFVSDRKGVRRVRGNRLVTDASVGFARLDVDARGQRLQLEIHPKTTHIRCPVEDLVS